MIPLDGPERALFEHRLLSSSEPVGPFALANTLGGILAAALVLILGGLLDTLRVNGKISRKTGILIVPVVCMIAYCLVLTKSRTAWVGCMTGVGFCLIYQSKDGQLSRWIRRGATGFAAIALLATGLGIATGALDREIILESPRSIQFRLLYWTGAAKVIGSRKNVVRVIERLGLESTQTGTRRGFSFRKYPLPPQELVANTIFSNLKITHNEKLYVIGVAFTDKDPYAAARIANTLIIEYLRSELLKELTAKHEVAFRELGELSKQFGSRHPNYVQLETRIRYLDSQIDMIRKREPTTENFASPGHHITPAMPILTPTGTSTKLALALGFCISFTLAVLAALLLEMYRSRNNKSPFLPRLR